MFNETTYILICAGEQTRWNNYLGVPKHFAPFDGEPLIERTIRQLNENNIKPENILVVSQKYNLKNATNIHITPNYEQNADADKFLSSAHLWNKHGQTTILYGDVYFTDQAIKTIIETPKTDWTLYCRPWKSIHTGCKWGECFAIVIQPKHHKQTLDQLHRIAELHKNRTITRCGGWELVRAINGKPDNQIRHPHQHNLKEYHVIDDLTDDIDYPEDYKRLKKILDNKQ